MKAHVLIIGLGLIGGSLAKSLQRHKEVHIAGYDADPMTQRKAYKMGIIHSAPPTLESAAREADIIIFATPVGATLKLMEQSRYWELKDGVILTDTGSTKLHIMEAANLMEKPFIGGHPIARCHINGGEGAQEFAF